MISLGTQGSWGSKWAMMAVVVAAASGVWAQTPGAPDKGADASNGAATRPATDPPASKGSPPGGKAPQGPSIKMGKAGVIDVLNFQGLDIRQALRLLAHHGRRNIVATREVTGAVTGTFYKVTIMEALDAICRANGYVYLEKGNFIYVYTPQQRDEMLKAERKRDTRFFRLSYLTAIDAKTLLNDLLSDDGTIALTPPAAMNIEQSVTTTGGNAYASSDVLAVSDYEENLRRIAEAIKTLDIKPLQVLVEAIILRATLTESNALGVDFTVLSGVNFQGLNTESNGLLDATTGVVTDSGLPKNGTTNTTTDFISGITGNGGLKFGYFNNEIAFFIRALEGVTDVTVMANPKLLIVDKQRGQVLIGNRDGYTTTTVTDTVATETVVFLETGTQLIVRPFIGRDGYIRMEIYPKDSSGGVVNGLPSETTTEVTSNVMVRDGHTIIIAGLFRERTSNERSQVPLLGNVPYVGELFRRTADNTVREEVIILITPRIIKQEDDAATSALLKDDVERFRVGQRKGLQWWGRSRLAQSHMRWAKQELRNGRSDKALWNVDMALSLSPRMEAAIRFKEGLTKRAYWADQARHSAAKYVIERMIMQELGKPYERIIPPRRPRDPRQIEPDVRKAMGLGTRFEDPLPGLFVPKPAPQSDGPQIKRGTTTDDKKKTDGAPADSTDSPGEGG